MELPEIQHSGQIWNSLEIAKLIFAALALVILAVLLLRIIRSINKQYNKKTTDLNIIKKRLDVYDRIATKLYDILCFYCYVGNWTEITPVDILNLKKELDKDMNIYSRLFTDEISNKYTDFIQLCFISSSGWEHDMKIKSVYELRQEHNVKWDDNWREYFDPKNVIEAVKMSERYNDLMDSFKKDLSL